MYKLSLFHLLLIVILSACAGRRVQYDSNADTIALKHAENISLERQGDVVKAVLKNPWRPGEQLQTYYLVPEESKTNAPTDGIVIKTPIRRAVVFTTAHANLMQMLGCGNTIAGVADAKYMLIPDVKKQIANRLIVDCGDAMAPDIERIIDLKPDALLLSPFENSGGHGKLDQLGIPLIECADYMETSALGRAEWMKFYAMLFGCEQRADSLFEVVEKRYARLKKLAATARQSRSVLPDRKMSAVWYVPGGRSSVGRLYADACGQYAFATDRHSGSLPMPFETVLEKMGQADFWILSYTGQMNRRTLLAEYSGYSALKAFRTGEIYGCKVDQTPYFEQVSWRPDWLLEDLVQLFHPELKLSPLRYYRRLQP